MPARDEQTKLLDFVRCKDKRGWLATKVDLQEFQLILDKEPAGAAAKDTEEGRTPMHHLAARSLSATEYHVQMFGLLLQRVPECVVQKDNLGKLPQALVKEATAEQPTKHNVKMLEMLLEANKNGVAVGIDIGLAFCCAAIFQNNKVEVIPNESHQDTTPHWVAFDGWDVHIGEAARRHAVKDAENSIFEINRFAGKQFQDPAIQAHVRELPFKVVNKLGGKPHVQVRHQDSVKDFVPEQLTALVLQRLKENAELYLGKEVAHCVLTAPAHYSEAQRLALKQSATMCGMNVLRVINEPTAAAMAYGLHTAAQGNILVYDLGGGSFDVTLLTVEDGIFDVKETAGDSQLGGADFDQRLAVFCVAEMKRKSKTFKDPTTDPCVMRKILNKCEQAKRSLSKDPQTTIEIDDVLDGQGFYANITRAKFEELCGDLFRATLDPVDRVLRNAKVGKKQVQKVVMVGGSTRIPKIQSLVADFFEGIEGLEIVKNVGADVCIATGAAIQAFKIANADTANQEEQIELESVPISIGVETAGGVMTRIVQRGAELPINEQSFHLCTITEHQPAILVQLYEGERLFARDNELLGRFLLDNIECGPRGEPVVLKVSYSKTGKITLKAECGGRSEKVDIPGSSRRFSSEEVSKKALDARTKQHEDLLKRKPIDLRNELENYAHWLKNRPASETAQMSTSAKALLEENIRATLDWLKANAKADVREIEAKKTNLETVELAAGKAYEQSETTSSTRIQRLD